MITDEYDVLSALQDGDQGLRLSGLCGLIYKDLREPELFEFESPIEGGGARRANDLSILKDLVLGLPLKVLELLVLLFGEVAHFLLLGNKILHGLEGPMIEVLDLLMQREVVHIGAD